MKKIITDFSYGEISTKFDGRADLPYYTKGCSELRNMYVMPQGVAGRIGGTEYLRGSMWADYPLSDDIIIPLYYDETKKAIILLELASGDLAAGVFYDNTFTMGYISSTGWSMDAFYDTQWVQINKDIILTNPSGKPLKISWNGSNTVTIAAYSTTGTAFDTSGNYPSCCCYHAGRLIFAGTANHPDYLWASKTLAPTNFTLGTNDDDAFSTQITTSDYNKILWVAPNENGIAVGTSTTESLITGGDNGLTPTALQQTKLSSFGSSHTDPVQVGLSTVFVQSDERRMRELAYTDANGALYSPDITLLADHLTESGIKRLAYQLKPFEAIFVLRYDGKVAMLTYDRNTGINAWSLLDLDREVVDICTLDGEIYFLFKQYFPNDHNNIALTTEKLKAYDSILCLAKESLQYNFTYMDDTHTMVQIEAHKMQNHHDSTGVYFTSVDSKVHSLQDGDKIILTEEGYPTPPSGTETVYTIKVKDTTSFYLCDLEGNYITDHSIFPYYVYFWLLRSKVFLTDEEGTVIKAPSGHNQALYDEGDVVQVFVGDRYIGTRTVDEYGEIDVGEDVVSVRVGFSFTSHMKTMRLMQDAIGNPVGRINKVYLRLWKSLGCKIGQTMEDSEEITFRDGELDLGTPQLYTGDKEHTMLTEYTTEGHFYVWTDDVYPLNISAMAVDFRAGGQRK